MAGAMSSCKALPGEIDRVPAGLPLQDALGRVATACRECCDVWMRFVSLSGPRWAYLAGERDALPATRPFCREPLTHAVGLVTDMRELIPDHQWQKTLDALRHLIARSK